MRREVGVDALLPAVRALGAQPQALRGAEEAIWLEVRRLEKDVGRRLADLAVLAAHDPGERDRLGCVRDDQVLRLELPVDAVEGPQLLARLRAPDDDLAPVKLGEVERVKRVPEREHDVVGDVDDVRDRAHAGGEEPRLQPNRGRAERNLAEEPADVARAAFEVVDLDLDRLLPGRLGVPARQRDKLQVVERRHLAGDSVDREQVGPVARRLHEQDVVDEREHITERSPRLGVRQHHDPGVVRAERDLVLGQDHPVRELAPNLALLELEAVRQHGPGQRDADGRARPEVPGAADDLARLALADVDTAELQAVGVRVLLRLEHLAHAEQAEVAVAVRDAPSLDPIDLGRGDREPCCELVQWHLDRHVVAQP